MRLRHIAILAARSAADRPLPLLMTLVAVALSVALLVGVERVREGARQGFSESVSGIDLIVGPRSSGVQLLLHSVFRMGEATTAMGWKAYQDVSKHPLVAWSVPLALGDSHRGYAVLGTTREYFDRFRYGAGKPLALASGRPFEGLFDVVVGSDVARSLGYSTGSPVVITHGMTGGGFSDHGDKPFKVVGVLAPTGTPVDRTLHVSLEALEAIHLDWQGGAPIPGLAISAEQVRKFDLTPKVITAALVGLESRSAVFAAQRFFNEYKGEALSAVLPGVALDELWETLDAGRRALLGVSAMVALVGIAGLVAVILAGLGERRRELAILRSVGARPFDVFVLLALEGVGLMLAGIALGLTLAWVAAFVLGPLAQSQWGVALDLRWIRAGEWPILGGVLAAGLVAAIVPGWRAYRLSLGDGLAVRR